MGAKRLFFVSFFWIRMEETTEPSPNNSTEGKKFWNTEKIVSLSAVLISIATLIVLIYQTNLMSKQQRLSVLPYLTMGNMGAYTPNFKYVIFNNGIGPAFVEKIEVKYKGKTYPYDLYVFLAEHAEGFSEINNFFYSNLAAGTLIPAQTNVEHLLIENSAEDGEKLHAMLSKLFEEGLSFEITYRSIYDERWVIKNGQVAPLEVD
jgi:hypothetical protein